VPPSTSSTDDGGAVLDGRRLRTMAGTRMISVACTHPSVCYGTYRIALIMHGVVVVLLLTRRPSRTVQDVDDGGAADLRQIERRCRTSLLAASTRRNTIRGGEEWRCWHAAIARSAGRSPLLRNGRRGRAVSFVEEQTTDQHERGRTEYRWAELRAGLDGLGPSMT